MATILGQTAENVAANGKSAATQDEFASPRKTKAEAAAKRAGKFQDRSCLSPSNSKGELSSIRRIIRPWVHHGSHAKSCARIAKADLVHRAASVGSKRGAGRRVAKCRQLNAETGFPRCAHRILCHASARPQAHGGRSDLRVAASIGNKPAGKAEDTGRSSSNEAFGRSGLCS